MSERSAQPTCLRVFVGHQRAQQAQRLPQPHLHGEDGGWGEGFVGQVPAPKHKATEVQRPWDGAQAPLDRPISTTTHPLPNRHPPYSPLTFLRCTGPRGL